MRKVYFIGQSWCNSCNTIYDKVVKPLKELYPDNVSIHYGWDETIQKFHEVQPIISIPLFVIEHSGVEEFRFNGKLSIKELARIIEYEGSSIELDDVLAGDFAYD